MPNFALIDALQDFGAVRRPAPRAAESAPAEPAAPPPPPEPPAEMFTRAELDEAVARALLEAEERFRVASELEAAASASARDEETDRLRRELGTEAGARIADRLAQLQAEVTETTGSVVARILGVALTEEVARNAVDQLGRAVAAALADRDAVRLRVSGPQSLIEALRPALGTHAERAEFIENEALDVTVALDSTLFETRISEWAAALADALSGGRA
jgi:hypothetical protein